ncbi:MAG: Glu-tRNA(Gln) amidotransferase subunit GatD [Candidatus Nanoarchaeia archaeon]|nr:Glu-tRNA(Gln) amidotransferase subunit GatD [Candidatus Nanoarchaeia archaeon]
MENFSNGDEVQVVLEDKAIHGKYVENPDRNFVSIKLDSGYNIGIEKKKVRSMKLIKKFHAVLQKKEAVKEEKGKKKIVILHTGGTISSAVDYATGAVTPHFTPEELVAMFPEIKSIANISSRLIGNMASDDMRFAHYNLMAREIEKEVKNGADGIIITHGTDTLHYTSAALEFMLENLPIPVVLVGSQRSSDRGSSDAAMNLISACLFIAKTDFAGVSICMHKGIDDTMALVIPGTNARKMHSSRRDAFKAVNADAIAEVDCHSGSVNMIHGSYKKAEKRALKVLPFKENLKIGIAVSHPNMFASEILAFEDYDGLVLEGTGLGHFPISEIDEYTKEHKKIFSAIEKIARKMPVVMALQTIYGRVDMNVYSPGRKMQDAGVLGNFSPMTPETAFVKLAWLLSNHPKDVKKLFMENLRGEIVKRVGVQEF